MTSTFRSSQLLSIFHEMKPHIQDSILHCRFDGTAFKTIAFWARMQIHLLQSRPRRLIGQARDGGVSGSPSKPHFIGLRSHAFCFSLFVPEHY